MAKKFEIVNSTLQVTDTNSSNVEFDILSAKLWFQAEALNDGSINLVWLDDPSQSILKSYPLSECVNDQDEPFTSESFRIFAQTNFAGNTTTTNSNSGWAVYSDTIFTEALPLTIVGGVVGVVIPNNAGSSITSQMPSDVTEFYDPITNTITGRNGDGINITMSFAVKQKTNSATRVTTYPDIGGTVGVIEDYKFDQTFSRGNGIEQRYLKSLNAYTLGTWEANGATWYIQADENCEIYNIRFLITRTHKAR